MLKIEVVIHPSRLDDVRATLQALGIVGALIHNVVTQDGQTKAYYRGAEYPADLPRVKIELLAQPERADDIVAALMAAARTSGSDDGMIVVYEVADAIRIRNGAHLQYTLS